MAITWGSASGNGKIGIEVVSSETNTSVTISLNIWVWTKYSCSDSNNTLYVNGSSVGSVAISTSVNTGSGWSTSNQKKVYTKSIGTITKGTSSVTKSYSAKISGVEYIDATPSVSVSYTVPALSSYKIAYNANSGSGAPSSQTKWYGKDLTLSSTKPTRTGYTFSKWNTNSSGTGTSYNSGATYTANAAATLYAVWTANTYKVTYNANGGSGAPSSQTKTYGVTLKLSTTEPTRTNYNFLGWGTSESATTEAYYPGDNYTKNSAITLYAIWELAYTKPRITGVSVKRCDSDGTSNEEGTYAYVSFSWTCDYATASYNISVDPNTTSGGTTIPGASDVFPTSGTTTTKTGSAGRIIGNGLLDPDTTYTISITVSDIEDSSTVTKTLSSIRYSIDFLAGGNGVAFNKAAELSGYMDIDLITLHRKDVVFNNKYVIKGTDPEGTVKEVLSPQNYNGNTVVGYGNYIEDGYYGVSGKSGNQTNIYGYDLMFGVSNIASPGVYKPYYSRGDTINLTFRTAGYITNSAHDLSFWIPLAKPVIGSPTVSIASNLGFVLRQGGNYTHGSAASTYIFPTSYEGTVTYGCGLYVKAVFSDVTNAINNDSTGIYWSGVIIFS